MCDDVQNCCRICLDMEGDHVSILEDPTINLHIKACLAITVSPNDNLPKTICMSCVSLLSQFYNLQLNARCSQDWLESSLHVKLKKTAENKITIQPLPDSEYNSDSLLEFLNNTANIEEYLTNLGKEDIPCIMNMLDKSDHNFDITKTIKPTKLPSPKKIDAKKIKLDTDISVTDFTVVKSLIKKDVGPKNKLRTDKNNFICFGCKTNYDSAPKLLQHLSLCDLALRTCVHCNMLFNSKQQMQEHTLTHNTTESFTCSCGKQFQSKEKLMHHHRTCRIDYAASMGCIYRCKECGTKFKERFALYKHAKEHIIKTDQKIVDICDQKFVGTDALTKHKKEEHKKVEDIVYRCRICSYVSTDRNEIYLHVKKHTKCTEPVRHLCESCGLCFASSSSLNRHILQHTNGKTFCNICNKHFMDSVTFDNHISKHVEITICEKCGQSINNVRLESHNCV